MSLLSSSLVPKTESWHTWHIPEMVYSFLEISSRKEEASPLQMTQEASATAPIRDRPVREVRRASIWGALLVAFMLDDFRDEVHDIHTLKEEVADAVEQVFDHRKERPHNGDTGNGFDYVEHDYLRSLFGLPKQGRPVAHKQKTRKRKGVAAMATMMPPMMCWQVVSSVISMPLLYLTLSCASMPLCCLFPIVVSPCVA